MIPMGYHWISRKEVIIMKLITRDTDYAIRALRYIAKRKDETVSVSTLVQELQIPRPFLRKLLQMLNKKGLLESYKGLGGGFQLKKSPSSIGLVDLVEIFQGPFSLNECAFKKEECPQMDHCRLRKKIGELETYLSAEMQAITLESLL
jgi:Rrf2 family protein